MGKFRWFEDENYNYIGSVWTCYNCGHILFVEDVQLDEEVRFIVCPECWGGGVFVMN